MSDGAIDYLRSSTSEGQFTGGDGTYSVPLPGGRTAWVFGDSFVGGVQPDGSRSHDQATFVRNSIVMQDAPGELRMVTGSGEGGEPVDAALPPGMRVNRDGNAPDQWYWPGHGTTRGEDDLLVLMNRFDQPTGSIGWGWRYRGTDLATFDARTGALRSTEPLLGESDVLWGAAVLERGEHTYVYGAETTTSSPTGGRHAHVARVERDQLADPKAWRFWDGSGWAPDASASARLGPQVSNQFGVVDAKDGGVLLVTQDGFDPGVRAWHAPSPEGSFTGGEALAQIPLESERDGSHVYNAVPHPHLTTDEGLLVSYNHGANDFMDDHASYRPGFLRIPHEELPGGGVQGA